MSEADLSLKRNASVVDGIFLRLHGGNPSSPYDLTVLKSGDEVGVLNLA